MVVKALSGEELAQRLRTSFSTIIEEWNASAVWVTPSSVAQVAHFLHDDPSLDFKFLSAISAIDFIEYFDVVYHLISFNQEHTGIVRARVYGRENPSLPSVYHVWRGADFQEREVWDLMGVRFEGHPNLKRIMLWEGFEGHPLRKDYL